MNKKADNETMEIKFRDLLGYIFSKWKIWLILLIVGALLGAGISVAMKNRTAKVVTQEEVDAAKDVLDVERAEYVEP